MKSWLSIFSTIGVLLAVSCSRESTSGLSQSDVSEGFSPGYVDIMPRDRAAAYKHIMPRVDDADVQSIISSSDTMWYDGESMIPGYQDSMGDPEGYRPNTIQPVLI